jgi:hypothetical protein
MGIFFLSFFLFCTPSFLGLRIFFRKSYEKGSRGAGEEKRRTWRAIPIQHPCSCLGVTGKKIGRTTVTVIVTATVTEWCRCDYSVLFYVYGFTIGIMCLLYFTLLSVQMNVRVLYYIHHPQSYSSPHRTEPRNHFNPSPLNRPSGPSSSQPTGPSRRSQTQRTRHLDPPHGSVIIQLEARSR